jgi:hypothetical protein
VAASAVAFTAALAAWAVDAVDQYKAPRPLVRAMPADQLFRDVRVAALRYFQPSLVFYCARQVRHLEENDEAVEFLEGPQPSYLFLTAPEWERLRPLLPVPTRLVASHTDLYRGEEIVVVTNE